MNDPLNKMKCEPCQGGMPPLTVDQVTPLLNQLEGWAVVKNHHIEKTYQFENFKYALNFVNQVGQLSEEENHHPDIYLTWGKVKITLYTHKIEGLSKSDFILASKIDLAKLTRTLK